MTVEDRWYCTHVGRVFVDIDQIRAEMNRLSKRTSSLVDDVSPLKDTSRKNTEDINTAKDDVSQLKGWYMTETVKIALLGFVT